MTKGGDWGPPALSQFSSDPPCATLIPRHLPTSYLFPPPKRRPLPLKSHCLSACTASPSCV